MITDQQAQTLIENKATVASTDGGKIGNVGTLYFDDDSGRPRWVTVKTGLFGTSESFVPLDGATVSGDTVTVPFSKDKVKDAPRMDADVHLDRDEEADLYRYYGLKYGVQATGTGDDDTLVRSEERVDVGTRRRDAGTVRLRKYVVTENVTNTVPVSHEEVRVEREPITAADRARGTGDLGEDVAEVTLHEDEVVTTKNTVPVEKVHLGKETVTESRPVTEQVKKERIGTETDSHARR